MFYKQTSDVAVGVGNCFERELKGAPWVGNVCTHARRPAIGQANGRTERRHEPFGVVLSKARLLVNRSHRELVANSNKMLHVENLSDS